MFAQMLKMAQHGLAVWWYEHRDTPRDELVDRFLDFCWTGLQHHLSPPTDTPPHRQGPALGSPSPGAT